MNLKALVAEFIGVFALCFVGIGAIYATKGDDLLAIALAHGLAIALMITALGHVSGGHFNPAVTLGMLLNGRISPVNAAGYWVAQLLGGVVGALFIGAIYGADAVAQGATVPGIGFSAVQALMAEVILTFFLVWVVFGAAVHKNYSFAGLAIGLTVAMDILVGGPVSGGAMNPARAFGPALVASDWTSHWVYWVGPLLGGALAATLYSVLYLTKEPEPTPAPQPAAAPESAPAVSQADSAKDTPSNDGD